MTNTVPVFYMTARMADGTVQTKPTYAQGFEAMEQSFRNIGAEIIGVRVRRVNIQEVEQ